jgi:hypothetical protein
MEFFMTHLSSKHPSRSPLWRSQTVLPVLALCSLPTSIFAAGLCEPVTQVECKSIASRNVYALLGNNVIAQVYGSKVIKQTVVERIDGTLIGIDFRPSQSSPADVNNTPGLYGLTDTGKIYQLNINVGGGIADVTLVNSLTTRFDGGFQSLIDFNPVVDALRVIGSNDQNYAVANSNGNLNATTAQTAITYAAGDTQANQNPNLTAGAYNSNIAGAATTIFYALDYATNSLVTIADVANGSSATGGGRLKTLGRIVDTQGRAINILPDAGIDIYTDPVIGNGALISNGRNVYFLNLAAVNINLPLGQTQNVVVKELAGSATPLVLQGPVPGAFMDIASTPTPVLSTAGDLAITESLNLGNFVNGQPFTIELTVTNQGPDSVSGVTFSATALPFKDPVVSTSQGACTVKGPVIGSADKFGRTFDCNVGTLAFGASATIKVNVSRLADLFAGAPDRVEARFVTFGPGGFLITAANDPDSTNNARQSTIFISR